MNKDMHVLDVILGKLVNRGIRYIDYQNNRNIKSIGISSKIGRDCDFKGNGRITIGNHTSIGPRNVIWTTLAKVYIGNYVLTGPQVTIISGNHITNHIGKYIAEFSDEDKAAYPGEYDRDILIEDDVWIGANVTILSGVHIAEGCVIAAGSVVTTKTIPYGIYGGVPAKLIKMRFTEDELAKHKEIMHKRIISRDAMQFNKGEKA